MPEPTGPLEGFRILDLTTILFGPFGAQILGDWGAEVIKVEALAGDGWRYAGQFRNRGMSGQFMAANRNKRSLALDLKHPDGKAVLRRLIPTVDAIGDQRPARRRWRGWASATRTVRNSIHACLRGGHRASARIGRGPPARPSTRSCRRPRASPPPWAPTTNRPSSPAWSATSYAVWR